MNKLSTTICAAVMSALPLYNAAANKAGEPMQTFGQEFYIGSRFLPGPPGLNIDGVMIKHYESSEGRWKAGIAYSFCNKKYNDKPFMILKIKKNGDVKTGTFYMDYVSKEGKKESDGIIDLVEPMAEKDSDFLAQTQELDKKIPPCQPEAKPKQ